MNADFGGRGAEGWWVVGEGGHIDGCFVGVGGERFCSVVCIDGRSCRVALKSGLSFDGGRQ